MSAADEIMNLALQAEEYRRAAVACEDRITAIRAQSLTKALERVRDLEQQNATLLTRVDELLGRSIPLSDEKR